MKGNLYLNKKLVEADITIPLTFISNQLNDLNDKRAGMTGTIIIEKTEAYNEDADIWNEKIVCDYYFNGIKLINNGDVRVLKFTKAEVHLKVYFGALLLAEYLKDLKINELQDSSLNVEWNLENIKNLSCKKDDVCFLFANASDDDNFIIEDKVNAKRLIPAVKVRRLISLIEKKTGITFEGNFKTDKLIDKLFMPIISNDGDPEKSFEVSKNEIANEIKLITTGFNVDNFSANILPIDDKSGACIVSNKDLSVNNESRFDLKINFNFKYFIETLGYKDPPGAYVDKTIIYDITFSCYYFVTKNWDGNILTLEGASIIKGGVDNTERRGGNNYSEKFEITLKNTELLTTDVLNVAFLVYAKNDLSGGKPIKSIITGSTSFTIESKEAVINKIGQIFPIISNLPQITALDFFKSLIQKKGFILDYDDINEKYILNYFSSLYENSLIADDWSDKYISYEITDIYGVFAKNNKFLYTNDSGINEEYGGYSEEIEKSPLPNEVIILQDITAATLQEKFNKNNNDFEICRLPMINDEKLEWTKLNARLLLVERKAVESIDITDGSVNDTLGTINRAWFMNGNNFNLDYEFLVKNYYSDYISMFGKYRKYTITAHLSSIDCLRNQLTPVFIKQLNAYFFIEKINFINENQLSTIEAIRL